MLQFSLIIISQAVLLLFSPHFKSIRPFSWYYYSIYGPLFRNPTQYQWKYWLVPTFYVLLYVYCTVTFFIYVLPLIHPSLYILEISFLPLMLLIPLYFGYRTVITTPYNSFTYSGLPSPYDEIIFHSNLNCRTCQILKPARSRHCPVCQYCIIMADHHCIWLNTCIGLGNYKEFYTFLLANCIVVCYAAIRLPSAAPPGLYSESSAFLALTILIVCFSIILLTFSYLQFLLVQVGMTTNEKDKWTNIHNHIYRRELVKLNDAYYLRIASKDDPTLYEYYSTNPYDSKRYNIDQRPYEVVLSHNDINNIYDKGSFMENLKERLRK